MTYYVYSTLTCDNTYNVYDNSGIGTKDMPVKVRSIFIKGGTGIATKQLVTPLGIATRVTDEEMEILLKDEVFISQHKAGFLQYRKDQVDAEVAAADMVTRDGSAPYVPEDTDEFEKVKPSEETKYGKQGKKIGSIMAAIVFDPVVFREQFPAFQCGTPISNAALLGFFEMATLYISNPNCGNYTRIGGLSEGQRRQCLYLMTAHLAAISRLISDNQATGVVTSATVDKVSVSLQPPPAPNQWQYWLNSTPYGQQLLALLQVAGVGGLYVGARPEITAFRRPTWY